MNQLQSPWKEYLQDRAVSDKASAAREYRVVHSGKPTGAEFASTYGFARRDGGLLIPLHPLIGGDQRYQLRYAPGDEPERKGKAQKFTTPRGQRNSLVTSPLTRANLDASGKLIFVCEGVTRVDALASYGIPSVGLTGVASWRGTNSKGGVTALSDWEKVCIKGNRFILAPDGDVKTNPAVHRACERLTRFLQDQGADNVMVLALPTEQGLDDFIAVSGAKDADALLTALHEHCEQTIAPPVRMPKASEDGFFEKDDVEPWSLSPLGDAYRLLAYRPDKVMVVRPSDPKGPWALMVEVAGGRWSYRDVDKLLLDSALAWHHEVTKRAISYPDAKSRYNAEKATKHAVSAATPRGRADTLASIGAVYGSLSDRNKLPKGLTICDESEIDADRFSIGTPDGVLCLRTGELLPPAEARARKVTRSLPDSYNKDASHPFAEALMAHLDPAERKYITDAFGWALRGNPSRRWYLLCGENGGGKTSLFTAVHAAMGDVANNGYSVWFEIESLLTSRFSNPNGHQNGLVGLHNARFAFGEEPPEHRNFNEGLVKNITGGGAVSIRDLNERGQKKPVMATMFVAMNPGSLPGLHLDSNALSVRTKLLAYPQLTVPLEERDADHQRLLAETKGVRQAVVAMLVGACRQLDKPPVDTPSIEAFLAERRDDAIGPVGVWLRSRLSVTNQHSDVVNLDALWDLLGEEFGVKEGGDIEGRDRRATWSLCREVVSGLPIVKRTRRGSEWRGAKLLTEEEADGKNAPGWSGEADAGPEESAGDINPASTPPVLYIAKPGTDIDAPWEYFPTDIPPFRYVIKDDGEKEWVLTPVPTELEGEAIIVPGTLNEEGEWVPYHEAVETLQGVADLAGGGDVYRDGAFSSFDIGPRMTCHVYSGPVGMWHKAREFGLLPGEECEECSEAMRRSHAPFKDQGALDGMPAPTREKH